MKLRLASMTFVLALALVIFVPSRVYGSVCIEEDLNAEPSTRFTGKDEKKGVWVFDLRITGKHLAGFIQTAWGFVVPGHTSSRVVLACFGVF